MKQFATVVETGSFSAAARRLNMGQPAVSKAIANLEEYLGVRLLTRTTRAQHLTEAGQRYYERARVVLDEADEAESAAREAATSLAGRLRLAAPPTYAALHILPRLSEFLDTHPDLAIDLILDDRWVDLIEQGVDLAIRLGKPADSSLVARRLGSSQRLLVASSAYLDRMGAPKTPEDLLAHRVVAYSQFEGATAWSFTRGTAAVSIAVQPTLRVSAAEGMRSCILAGLGIGMGSRLMFTPELAAGTVRPVLTEWGLSTLDVWAMFPSGRKSSRRARAFVDWLEVVVGGDGELEPAA
ncbi:MAG: LysR family transcriptional regulator [Sphingomonadales bacterium]|uniref:LysR family transcriptional regulator n=1 Tax=unclassified Novosphingobium TaxID=2644732 RepID=UPI0018D1690E|nr:MULTISPECIES: LysR family transcriptional regulator [unclassified Novosphingobium]MBU6394569.1 LysR family transcriptional regulator [Sphingomonadales bacterium]